MRAKLTKTYNLIIRLLIIITTFGFLYRQLSHNNDFQSVIDYFPSVSSKNNFWPLLSLVLILMFVNYLIESYKWKFFIRKLENISISNSFKAVLTGMSVSMFMPNRVGDYLGRVFILKKANRIKAIIATIIGGMSQLITTLIFGAIALLISFPAIAEMDKDLNRWAYAGLILLTVTALFAIIFAYLNFASFKSIIKRISGRAYRKVSKYADVFSIYEARDMLIMIILSIIRYLIFSLQFIILLYIFEIRINYFHAMVLISLVYLAVTIIPTIALTELGVRGSVSVFIFDYYFNNYPAMAENIQLGVVSASTSLWFINLVIPAALGAIFVFSLKFFRKNKRNGNLD